jgi:tRNA uridine 5-carboxymethylaminomethyl modification enzyme
VRRLRHLLIPKNLDPCTIPGLSREVTDLLERHRPRTIADAERLPGMTPAAVAILVGRVSRDGESWPES